MQSSLSVCLLWLVLIKQRTAKGWVCVVQWYLVSVRTFGVMYDHTFLNLSITRSDIRQHIMWAVSLVIKGPSSWPWTMLTFVLNIQWHTSVPKAQPVTVHRASSVTACWQSSPVRLRSTFKYSRCNLPQGFVWVIILHMGWRKGMTEYLVR